MKRNTVRAIVRLRPLLIGEPGDCIWHVDEKENTVQQLGDSIIRKYYFDYVAPPRMHTGELYQVLYLLI